MITPITNDHFNTWLVMAQKLWPDYNKDELECEFKEILASSNQFSYFYTCNANIVAFATISLRTDYVQGSKKPPTGYLEAIFVEEEYRRKGIAKEMLCYAEQWAKDKGCSHFGSDCLIVNSVSELFHKQMGFKEENRTINFIKEIH